MKFNNIMGLLAILISVLSFSLLFVPAKSYAAVSAEGAAEYEKAAKDLLIKISTESDSYKTDRGFDANDDFSMARLGSVMEGGVLDFSKIKAAENFDNVDDFINKTTFPMFWYPILIDGKVKAVAVVWQVDGKYVASLAHKDSSEKIKKYMEKYPLPKYHLQIVQESAGIIEPPGYIVVHGYGYSNLDSTEGTMGDTPPPSRIFLQSLHIEYNDPDQCKYHGCGAILAPPVNPAN